MSHSCSEVTLKVAQKLEFNACLLLGPVISGTGTLQWNFESIKRTLLP